MSHCQWQPNPKKYGCLVAMATAWLPSMVAMETNVKKTKKTSKLTHVTHLYRYCYQHLAVKNAIHVFCFYNLVYLWPIDRSISSKYLLKIVIEYGVEKAQQKKSVTSNVLIWL